jgi:uncharacterized protein (TIGR04255 family)
MMAQRVQFERPPVVEVVCGVQFGSLPGLRTAHVGVFWDLIREEFPSVDEAPPLPVVIETQGPFLPFEIEIGLTPPIPRSWFRTADGHGLVQLQRDRFVYNWKRDSPDDGDYPSYDVVIVDFERLWSVFTEFVAREKLGELVPRQLELAYVNIIPVDSIPDGDAVFVDHTPDLSRSRFLPDPDSFEWRTSYLLPDNSGRLHILVTAARENVTGAPVRKLDMIARGINEAGSGTMRSWFDLAHEWIVHGFADVTTSSMQKNIWERQA